MASIFKLVKNPAKIVYIFDKTKISRLIPDIPYLKLKFTATLGKKLDLRNPQTLNEKVQWLKLFDRCPEYIKLVDKYEVKQFVSDRIGAEYIIPTFGIWDNVDDIDFDSLPNKFVLKCTHDSGGLVICRDKSKLNKENAKKKLKKSLKKNFYYVGREWPYKDVPHRIICEQYITDSPNVDVITDYKFYCFNGEVDSVLVCVERQTGAPKFYFFDKEWNLLRYTKHGVEAPNGFTIPRPQKIDEMFIIAEQLSKHCSAPFVRIDLYCSDNKIYFGEYTFYSDCGFDRDILPEIDFYFGQKINLERLNGNTV